MTQHTSKWRRLKLAVGALGMCLCAFGGSAIAANTSPDGLWDEISESAVTRSAQARQIVPNAYRTLKLNRAELTAQLAQVPEERLTALENSQSTLLLPTPEGGFNAYRVVETAVLAAALAKRFPTLKTYVGQGITDPTATLRFDLTDKGFRAQIISWRGTSYIDPFQPGDLEHYIAYRKADYLPDRERPKCLLTGQDLPKDLPNFQQRGVSAKIVSGASLRTYRLAMAATGEFTAFHGGTVLDGLGAIVTTVNRINGIYEREVAVRMQLIANTELVIYTDSASDPYSNNDGSAMLGQNLSTLNSVIGAGNYDIGHVVSTGGGGVAGLGVVCTGGKARGVTGLGSPITDSFDVDFVAHEMGHQFAGSHTFNGSGGNCSGGNRSGPFAYETGSGVTVQAYAGICSSDNVQPNSEDYFHRVSLNQILNFTTSGAGSTCGANTVSGNTPPSVSTPPAYTIPRQTPFELIASGQDANGDTLTYLWEQFDLGAANPPGNLIDNGGPLFRSFAPTLEPSRIVPSLRFVLNNANVPPTTAPLPGTNAPNWFTGELLASTARALNFRVTVRDNRAGAGGTNEAATVLTVADGAGPFALTAPNSAVTWAASSAQTVTWNVAATDSSPVSTANVRIRLSVDGGNTWPTVLTASTPNNGSANIVVPANAVASTQARVRVEAVDNIYFDVSDVNFTITGSNTAPLITLVGTGVSTRQGSPAATATVATISDTQDAASALTVSVSGAPPELGVSVVNNNGSVSLTATAQCTLVAPGGSGSKIYPVLLRVTDSAGAGTSATVNISVGANQTPTLGNYTGLSIAPNTTTLFAPTAAPADLNNNLIAPSVSPSTLTGGGSVSIASNGVVTVTTLAGTTLGTYAIRASAIDSCGATEQRQFSVTLASPNAALALSSSSIATGNALIEPSECNQLNVTVSNSGSLSATGVTAVLSTTTPNITIFQPNTAFADIPSGQSRTSLTPFQISSNGSLACFSNVNLTLTVSYSGGPSPLVSNLTFPVGTAGTNNYAFSPVGGSNIPPGGALVAGSEDDDAIVNLTVPDGFNFSVYGTNVSGGQTIRASTNGTLQLTPSGGSRDYENGPLPSAGDATFAGESFPAALPVLMAYWDDLNMNPSAVTGGGIFQQVTGTAPTRKWIIEWRGEIYEQAQTGTAITINFAIELSEGASTFSYLYGATGSGPGANGASATIGVQAATTGTSFGQFLLNQGTLLPNQTLNAAIFAGSCVPGRGGCIGTAPTSTSLQSSLNPSLFRQPVTFTASVISAGAPVGVGTVNFLDGAAVLCSNVAVSGLGQAVCTTSALLSGSRLISANYLGGGTFGTSSSSVLTQIVNISPIVITPTTLPNPVLNAAYSRTLTATSVSALAPISFSVTGGTLPTGLALSSAGVLSGTPTVLGPFSFTVTATDSAAPTPLTGTRTYSGAVLSDLIFANGFQ